MLSPALSGRKAEIAALNTLKERSVFKLSIMNLVENRFDEIRIGNDDQLAFYIDAVNTLTKEQKEIFYKECDIVDELEKTWRL